MSKAVLVIVVLAVVGGGGFLLYQNFQTTSSKPSSEPSPLTVTTPTPTVPSAASQAPQDTCQIIQQGSADVPPLYEEGITWQQPSIGKYEVGEYEDPSAGEGFSSKEINGCLIKTTISLEFANKIRVYYSENLPKDSWREVSTADGPSSFEDVFKKDKKYFVINRLNDRVTLFHTQ